MFVIAKITTQENTHAQNLKATARTQKLIDAGKSEIDIGITESIRGLVNHVSLYRGVNRASAKKIVSELLGELK